MLAQHVDTGAGVTVAGVRVPVDEATQSGVIESGEGTVIRSFKEKPSDPAPLPDDRDHVVRLHGQLRVHGPHAGRGRLRRHRRRGLRARRRWRHHPHARRPGHRPRPRLHRQPGAGGEGAATMATGATSARSTPSTNLIMDLSRREPKFHLHNARWPIHTSTPRPSPRQVRRRRSRRNRPGAGLDGLLRSDRPWGHRAGLGPVPWRRRPPRCRGGALRADARRRRSERGAVVRNTILDKNVEVPAGAPIGVDADADRERFSVSDKGTRGLGKDEKHPASPTTGVTDMTDEQDERRQRAGAGERRRKRPAHHAGHRRRQRHGKDHRHRRAGRGAGPRSHHVGRRRRLSPLRPGRAQVAPLHAAPPQVQLHRHHGAASPASGRRASPSSSRSTTTTRASSSAPSTSSPASS